MKKIMLIDGMNQLWAAHFVNQRLKVGERHVGATFGIIKQLRTLLNTFPDYTPIVLWDGKKNWRKDFYPEYKASRGKQNKDLEIIKPQKAQVAKMINLLGVDQIIATEHEADDLAGFFVTMNEKKKQPDTEYLLVTADKDWAQLVDNNCDWYNPRSEAQLRVSALDFEHHFGISASQFLDLKALQGDMSDNIPGVGGIGEKTGIELLKTYGSVVNLVKQYKAGKLTDKDLGAPLRRLVNNERPPSKTSPKTGETIEYPPMLEAFQRNVKLMDLANVPTPSKSSLRIVKGMFDAEAFEDECYDNNFTSITSNFLDFVRIFETKAKISGKVKTKAA